MVEASLWKSCFRSCNEMPVFRVGHWKVHLNFSVGFPGVAILHVSSLSYVPVSDGSLPGKRGVALEEDDIEETCRAVKKSSASAWGQNSPGGPSPSSSPSPLMQLVSESYFKAWSWFPDKPSYVGLLKTTDVEWAGIQTAQFSLAGRCMGTVRGADGTRPHYNTHDLFCFWLLVTFE